jgi:hypothetical protein
MSKSFRHFLVLTLILSFSSFGLAQEIYTESGQRIAIRVDNLAEAPKGTLARAIK